MSHNIVMLQIEIKHPSTYSQEELLNVFTGLSIAVAVSHEPEQELEMHLKGVRAELMQRLEPSKATADKLRAARLQLCRLGKCEIDKDITEAVRKGLDI